MSKNPFQSIQNNVPIIGQPFQLHQIMCPVSAKLTCNCGGPDTAVEIKMSTQANCPSCGRGFNIAFNPTTQKIEMSIAIPKPEVPS